MTSPSKNDITGDRLISKQTTDAYRENWERIFGKQKEKETMDKCCGKCSPCSGHSKEDKDANSTD